MFISEIGLCRNPKLTNIQKHGIENLLLFFLSQKKLIYILLFETIIKFSNKNKKSDFHWSRTYIKFYHKGLASDNAKFAVGYTYC